MNLMVLAVGAIFFALSLNWWAVPLTLVTYAALVLVAFQDPLFRNSVLGEAPRRSPAGLLRDQEAPQEQVPGRLPPGETRRRVEKALEARLQTVIAIEESNDAVQGALSDALPKLHLVIERLLDLAEKRERVARQIQALRREQGPSTERPPKGRRLDILEEDLRAADREISATLKMLSSTRRRVVRISTESESVASRETAKLNTDLDEMNLRLDASLRPAGHPREPPGRR
jgi:hypothetical protein